MRTITDAQKQALEDLSAEGLLGGLPVQTAEKDIHITELLKALSKLEVYHDHFANLDTRGGERVRRDAGIRLIFAGGTCLSKAYGLIHRMSEDVDIKVVLDPVETPLKKDRGDRARLKSFHAHLPKLLEQLGFPILEYPEGKNPVVLNSHRYYVIGAGYKTVYGQLPSLRPELKLEILQRDPLLPLERRQFGYLHESLAGIPLTEKLEIECISVGETAAEKVLSLLRRCAYRWDGHQKEGDIDHALVRHVYDVSRIAALSPESLKPAKQIFAQLVMIDREEFQRQNPQFDEDPIGVLQRTLAAAKQSAELEQRYLEQVLPLVFSPNAPSFQEAFASFEDVAREFLASA